MTVTPIATLTARQRAVLDAIRESVRDRGFPPTCQEVAKTVGLASLSSVTHQLRALQQKGFIERLPGTARGIRILDPEPVGPARG